MATYQTPGVYVEEISTLPPSVAEVSTAVPAFVGYTEKAVGVRRISTLLEFVTLFGGPKPSSFNVETVKTLEGIEVLDSISRSQPSAGNEHLLYYCISHYFKNGGGACYIVSVGTYDSQISKTDFINGLSLLEKEDEPTLIVMPEATLLDKSDCHELYDLALAQCQTLGDRLAILDVKEIEDPIATFRDGVGTKNLMYGAAYYPYLDTTLSYAYKESGVSVLEGSVSEWSHSHGGLVVTNSSKDGTAPRVRISNGTAADDISFTTTGSPQLAIDNVDGKTAAEVVAAWEADTGNDQEGFSLALAGEASTIVTPTSGRTYVELTRTQTEQQSLEDIQSTNTALYNQILAALSRQRIRLPPSPAMAGVYATVDRTRGVWKAPANISLTGVIAPAAKINDADQKALNVDPTAGKSINAIRAFSGKGVLVWGARTLAGNDNEWRYISVRRLFNTIEESTRKATAFAVFEPNNAATWLKVKAMIQSYLYGLWQQGALMGSKPESAYFVQVGLDKTMSADDVNEGRMIVEIGIAAVRPAEFIILRFSHKLVES